MQRFSQSDEGTGPLGTALHAQMALDIRKHLERPAAPYTAPGTLTAPPGSPIGSEYQDWLNSPAFLEMLAPVETCSIMQF